MNYEAILFDLDGTLVDSTPLWIKAYTSTLEEYGVIMSEADFLQEIYYSGIHLNELCANLGIAKNDCAIFRQKRDERHIELLSTQCEWLTGAKETLTNMQSILPLGLMTGSWTTYVDAIDARLHIKQYFKHIVSCDDTISVGSKPNPYGLELLAKKMNVTAKACLYVGDQLVDVQAANAAGMVSCLIPITHTPEGVEKQANIILDNLHDLKLVL